MECEATTMTDTNMTPMAMAPMTITTTTTLDLPLSTVRMRALPPQKSNVAKTEPYGICVASTLRTSRHVTPCLCTCSIPLAASEDEESHHK